MREAGLSPRVLPWDADGVSWGDFALVVIRSTWDYHHRADDFVRWAEAVGALTHLHNPAPVVRWNAHKRYLLDLEDRGISVVPSALLQRGWSGSLEAVVDSRGWHDIVIKPAVSAGSHMTLRSRGASAEAEAHVAHILATRDALVQPYLPEVETSGERAVVCIGGEVTHAVRKSPRFLLDDESVSGALRASPAETALARAALNAAGFGPLLYARVDMVRDGDSLRLMELELIEPSLFLRQHPPALEALVRGITGALASGRA